LIEGCFYRPILIAKRRNRRRGFVPKVLKIILGIEPSIILPKEEKPQAQYSPKVLNANKIIDWKFGLQHRRGELAI
jgi:hypothetical protein